MKKIAIIMTICATTTQIYATTGTKCAKNLDTVQKLTCQYNNNRAPAYFTGCYDVYAPEVGEEKAAQVCAAEYEQHKHNKKIRAANKKAAKVVNIDTGRVSSLEYATGFDDGLIHCQNNPQSSDCKKV